MRLRSSYKLAIGFVVLAGGIPLSYKLITDWMILGQKFPEIKPGKVTLLGIDAGSDYHIIVANRVAALVEGGPKFAKGEMSEGSQDADTRKKLSIKDMLQVLQGNDKPLGRFIMALNEIKEGGPDWPTAAPYWDAEDVQKALDGDQKLRTKLEADLNVKLDGTPLNVVRPSALLNGVILRIPVPVKVAVAGKVQIMVGRVLQPYRPRFCIDLESQKLHDTDYTSDTIRGHYAQEAESVRSGSKSKENIARSLSDRIGPSKTASYANAPTLVLSQLKVILSESFITGARMTTNAGDAEKRTYNLVINLTDEGRRRLWQYSKLYRGTQLLFVVNGTAIAAPVVGSELPGSEVTMVNIPDADLVKDAVDTLNANAKGNK